MSWIGKYNLYVGDVSDGERSIGRATRGGIILYEIDVRMNLLHREAWSYKTAQCDTLERSDIRRRTWMSALQRLRCGTWELDAKNCVRCIELDPRLFEFGW